MTPYFGEPDANLLTPLLDSDTAGLKNFSAPEYFFNLMKYLRNVTIVLTRPRPSDLIPLDRCAGLVWVILIPIIYFVAVALVLGCLLVFFWYADSTGVVSAAQSEVSVASAELINARHDTVVVNEASVNSSRPSAVRSYLINNTDFQTSFRTSEASKGSTRSLGVLTDNDLQLPLHTPGSIKRWDFAAETRRLSKSIQEFSGNNGDALGLKFSHRFVTKFGGSCQSPFPSTSDLKMKDIASTMSKNSTSFSTDSLEESVSRHSLRASMETQKVVLGANGEIGPEDLYGRKNVASEINKSNSIADTNMNFATESKTENKLVFRNLVFTDEHAFIKDTDEYLKTTYQTALKMDKTANILANRTDQDIGSYGKVTEASSSTFGSTHFPGNLLVGLQISESTPRRHASPNDTHETESASGDSQMKKLAEQGLSVTNTGSNVQNAYLDFYNESVSPVESQKTSLSVLGSGSLALSPVLQPFESYEQIDGEESQSVGMFRHHKNYQQLETDTTEFHVSSVSHTAMTSSEDCDLTQDSVSSGTSQCDESSLYSPTNSLPSSIARFHASKVGRFPVTSAGYPLPCTEEVTLDETIRSDDSKVECSCDDSHGNYTERSSLCANYGSCSQSSAVPSIAPLSQEYSFDLSQDENDYCEKKFKPDQEFVRLSKRPSPLSSFVHNFRQRYSLDENVLKCRRGTSDEEEALIGFPLMHQEPGIKHKRHQSLDFRRERVTVEQRLQEFGFLKGRGKNGYFINPSPGKFETGAGYSNHVFKNSEDDRLKFPDGGWKPNITPEMQISTRNNSLKDRLAQRDTCGSTAAITQLLEGSTNSFQASAFLDQDMNHLQRPSFEHSEEDINWEDVASSATRRGRLHTEAHGEAKPMFTDIDLNQSNRQAKQTAREVSLSPDMSRFSGHRQLNNFSQHEVCLFSLSGRIAEEILERKESDFYGERKSSCDAQSNYQMQHGTREDVLEIETTEQSLSITTKNSDIDHSNCSDCRMTTRKLDHTMLPLNSNCTSVMDKRPKLKRQHTSRALV